MNLMTTGLGTGILCLPWLMAGASILPGLAIIAVVLAVNAWTTSILVHASDKHQVFDLGGLLAKVGGCGGLLQVVSNVIIWVSTFLCLISYILVISGSAQSTLLGGALPDWFAVFL